MFNFFTPQPFLSPISTVTDNATSINWAQISQTIVTVLLAIGSISSLIMVVWSGFRMTTSSGDQAKLASARFKLIYSLVGLFVMVGAFVIWQLILTFIGAGDELNFGF